jgi:hypothetical protein
VQSYNSAGDVLFGMRDVNRGDSLIYVSHV